MCVCISILSLSLFKAHQHKAAGRKTRLALSYKIMVATAIYSVTTVLWEETAFPLWMAMERHKERNVVSRFFLLFMLQFLGCGACKA